jgi:hypothetical protein
VALHKIVLDKDKLTSRSYVASDGETITVLEQLQMLQYYCTINGECEMVMLLLCLSTATLRPTGMKVKLHVLLTWTLEETEPPYSSSSQFTPG